MTEGTADAEAVEADGGRDRPQAHTVRLELADEPGQLLAALRPIADEGANLLSIFHERGHLTPRGRIPVEVDLECPPSRFESVLDALRAEGVSIVEADAEQYGEHLMVMLVGDLVGTDLSDTVMSIESSPTATVEDLSLSAPGGAAAGVRTFSEVYNEFWFSQLMNNGQPGKWAPIVDGLLSLQRARQFEVTYEVMAAGSIMAVIPVAILVVIAQEKIVSGLTSGALKE